MTEFILKLNKSYIKEQDDTTITIVFPDSEKFVKMINNVVKRKNNE